MKIEVHAVICLALLASASQMPANAQTANGSQQNNGNKQTTSTVQTNGQKKSGQVMHPDYDNARSSMPNELAALAPHLKQTAAQVSGSGNGGEKIKVRQEFGPQQASKHNDAVVAPGSGSKPKTDTKAQAPK